MCISEIAIVIVIVLLFIVLVSNVLDVFNTSDTSDTSEKLIDYGYYNLDYRIPVLMERQYYSGLVWCGTERCSSQETVPRMGNKIGIMPCPIGYSDRGFKAYPNNVYRRVCELNV